MRHAFHREFVLKLKLKNNSDCNISAQQQDFSFGGLGDKTQSTEFSCAKSDGELLFSEIPYNT